MIDKRLNNQVLGDQTLLEEKKTKLNLFLDCAEWREDSSGVARL